MQTLDADTQIAEGVQSESSEIDPRKEVLDQVETEVGKLEAAFGELANLKSLEQEADAVFQEACAEEQKILQSESSEKESVKTLLQIRAQKDLLHARLLSARKRVALEVDAIAYDIGASLRKAFAIFAHALLAEKQAEMAELFNDLLPAGSIPGINNRDLVYACAPVLKRRQILNWCNDAPRKDQAEELDQLRELPCRWLAALRELTAI
jgi:hypothetical protein